MPIPRTRQELVSALESSFDKLTEELAKVPSDSAGTICVDDWTIRDLIAVRHWWSQAVLGWIIAGKQGSVPDLPATGYRWNQTPALNAEIILRSADRTLDCLILDLSHTYEELSNCLAGLSDVELLEIGQFEWAGKHPICRWVSINTVRQYTTARSLIRRCLR